MPTTIQVSQTVKKHLDRLKLQSRETYDALLDRILEDFSEVNEETKMRLEEAHKAAKEGKLVPHEAIKRKLGLR